MVIEEERLLSVGTDGGGYTNECTNKDVISGEEEGLTRNRSETRVAVDRDFGD